MKVFMRVFGPLFASRSFKTTPVLRSVERAGAGDPSQRRASQNLAQQNRLCGPVADLSSYRTRLFRYRTPLLFVSMAALVSLWQPA